jgi:hypothetical protein
MKFKNVLLLVSALTSTLFVQSSFATNIYSSALLHCVAEDQNRSFYLAQSGRCIAADGQLADNFDETVMRTVVETPGRTYSLSRSGLHVGPSQIYLLDVFNDQTPMLAPFTVQQVTKKFKVTGPRGYIVAKMVTAPAMMVRDLKLTSTSQQINPPRIVLHYSNGEVQCTLSKTWDYGFCSNDPHPEIH